MGDDLRGVDACSYEAKIVQTCVQEDGDKKTEL